MKPQRLHLIAALMLAPFASSIVAKIATTNVRAHPRMTGGVSRRVVRAGKPSGTAAYDEPVDQGRLHPAVARVAGQHDGEELLDALSSRMSGSDLTSLMLEVTRRRVMGLTAANVLDQYERDRFVRPAVADARRLLDLERGALDAVAPPFAPVANSPLVPLGTHSVVAGVHQNRVVTTTRGNEVAADPTNTLALEAAVRRRTLLAADSRSRTPVHLASVDRVVRAQRFEGPRSFAHFCLLGLVTAGRDTGTGEFDLMSMRQHLQTLAAVCERSGYPRISIRLTDFGRQGRPVIEALVGELGGDAITITESSDRTAAKGYYPGLCFKLSVVHRDEEIEIGDGGLVDWTRALLSNNKERLMISGLSLERLAVID